MAAVRFSHLKRLQSSIKGSLNVELCHNSVDMNLARSARLPSDSLSNVYYKRELQSPRIFTKNQFRSIPSECHASSSPVITKHNALVYPGLSPSFRIRGAVPFASMSPGLNCRTFSSVLGGKGSRDHNGTEVAAGAGDVNAGDDSVVAGDLAEKVKDTWKSVVETATHAGEKVKEASDELTPYAQQLLDSHPYLNKVVIPVGSTLTATLVAWFLMPWILRKFHKYAMKGPISLIPGSTSWEQVTYEKSFWGAMEDPVRYLVTFITLSQIGAMVAPTTITSQYLVPAWRGAAIISFVWFLHRWKTNVFHRTLSNQGLLGLDREKLLTLDRISSVGLFMIGIMALAEACGVAVQSIVTVGGIGGVATAFAARDILGNVFSGLSMQFSRPFSIGDTIKAGSVEGQVVEMGLTTTSLLSTEKFPVIVPNSFFSSQVIVNKSRAECRGIISKIPLQIEDLSKIPQLSEDIKSMLRSHAKVFLGKEVPYCFLSRVESSYAELTIGYNLKHMRKDELFAAEQDVLLHAVQVIKNHGIALGSTLPG
ncbi:mechanosensitive ion channel protein 1, mitochondrial [Arachis stenosperma]|uniref:mechanosensitive ion channel protein 1, mitochondrial n=1 Tax=Arachis stenosperma TaxID=217475 RepID=UPI0025AD629F|nr:mechanosensitive ion channel protein 1, mitochondrial [Arachis stenosperma]